MMDASMRAGEHLNVLCMLTEDFEPKQKQQFREAITPLMAIVFKDIMIPIIREYPDLDPDGPWPSPAEDETGRS